MLRGKFDNIIADGISFQFLDLVEITKHQKLFSFLWKAGILLTKVLKVTINRDKLGELFLYNRIFVVYEGKNRLGKQIDNFLEGKGIYVNKVMGVSTRRELDELLKDNVIKFYMSKDGRDLFKRIARDIVQLGEIL